MISLSLRTVQRQDLRTYKDAGFTIVELLIVIVVIGILAAITLVAYNGVQNRARTTSVSSGLNQVAKKVALQQVDSPGVYPADKTALLALGITESGSLTYQYSVNNVAVPATYCVTATNGDVSYHLNNTTVLTPTSGGCAGHGVGGVSAATNLATNPSMETNTTGWSAYTGVGLPTRVTANHFVGAASLSATGNNTHMDPRVYHIIPVAAGDIVYASGYVRSDGQVPTNGVIAIKTRLVGAETGTPVYLVNAWAPDANGWLKVSASYTVPANVDGLSITYGVRVAVNYTGVLGVDGVMITKNLSSANYADGSSPNWVWNGAVNNSTSTGPPL